MGSRNERKVGAALLQPLDDFEEVADRAGEAIEADDGEDIAGPDLAHQSGEFRPSPRRSRAVLLVDCRAARRVQLVGLGVRGLILGGDPRVAQKTSCRAGMGAGEGSAGHESLLCQISKSIARERPVFRVRAAVTKRSYRLNPIALRIGMYRRRLHRGNARKWIERRVNART